MGGWWLYSWCLVGCCRQDLFNIARSILALLPSSFFSSRFFSVHVVHPYSSIDTIAAWKKLRFILSVRSDFHMIDSLLIAVHAFVSRVSIISARRPDQVIKFFFFKRKISGLCRPDGLRGENLKKKRKRRKEKHVLGSCQRTKKAVEHERDFLKD